jgi:hypothetical protein
MSKEAMEIVGVNSLDYGGVRRQLGASNRGLD